MWFMNEEKFKELRKSSDALSQDLSNVCKECKNLDEKCESNFFSFMFV